MKILILGVNGFIGSNLARHILASTDWELYGMDLSTDKLKNLLDHPNFHFLEGDIAINREWIEYHIKKCDLCLPLVAIATPASYMQDPLRVFELDFEENLRVIRQCVKYHTRVIFPSTSEVYGMCPDKQFSEEKSPLVYGPIQKQRWIYACAKQLMDRVIWAYGRDRNLQFTLIRPFNWIGPGLDRIDAPKEGSSRVVTQFLGHLLREEPIKLVDGGKQRRSFTYIDDGIDALMKIIENKNGACDGQIFNLGNPRNDISIRDLARKMVEILTEFTPLRAKAEKARIEEISSEAYYGGEYEDMPHRVPDITRARKLLKWEPRTGIDEALRKTIRFYSGISSEKAADELGYP